MTKIVSTSVDHRTTKYATRYRYRGESIPSVTQIIDAMRLRPSLHMISPDVLQAACDRGDRVHATIAVMLKGKKFLKGMVKTEERGYIEAFEWWRQDHNPVPMLVEQALSIKTPIPHGGTLDFAGHVGSNRLMVVDWKTRPLGPGDGFQLVAYGDGLAQRSGKYKQFSNAELMGVELRKNGTYKTKMYNPLEYRRTWQEALRLWSWRHAHGV